MSFFDHLRQKIFTSVQHPYSHSIGEMYYSNPRIGSISNASDALNYIIAFLYPNYKGTAATPAALPGVATLNDYYFVTDDGDGKSAGYIYSSIDGVNQWIKRYDVDWSYDSILSETLLSTRPIYVHKWGTQDRDQNAALFVGDLAGQRIYGGNTANEHLILYANSGDAVGNTGYVQTGDNFRPLVDSTYYCGTTDYRWLGVFTDSITSGTLTLTSGSITDTSGSITFVDENLLTTGTLGCGVLTAATGSTIGNLTLANGSITDSSGAISFDNENLLTTGTLSSGTHTIGTLSLAAALITDTTGSISFDNENLLTTGTFGAGVTTVSQLNVDNIRLDGNAISITNVDGNLSISANGTGVVDITSAMTTIGQTITGIVVITGQLNADNIRIDANIISSTNVNGNIGIDPDGTGVIETYASIIPTQDITHTLGDATHRYLDLFISGNIKDGTDTFLTSELMDLRSANYRDFARTTAVQNGDSLFWDAANGVWLANHPDTEITHSELSGLTTTDAGHTQFVMLAGRVGGQVVQGGTAASENLDLESTTHATKGDIRVKDDLIPFTNASYAAGWLGTDLGDSSHYFRDLYSKGEFKGFRFENYTFATLPASSGQNIGRVVYTTDTQKVYVDNGTTFKAVGVNKYISDIVFNGVETTKNVDVSSTITDARNSQFELLDNTNNFEKMFVKMEATSATNVRITTNVALAAGSYRLIVLEQI